MKARSTRRALLTSLLSLLLCVTMLMGTTYAWFTDSVTSAGNKVVAGNLDVKLYYYDGTDYVDISTSDKPLFGADGLAAAADGSSTLWEPNKTQVVYLAIENAGSLALKYKVALNVTDVTKDLTNVLRYTITPDAKGAALTAWDDTNAKSVALGSQIVSGTEAEPYVPMQPGDMHYFALSVHMLAEAGNEYMNGTATFDLTVLATQLASEEDSFGKEYDDGLDITVGTDSRKYTQLTKDGGVYRYYEDGEVRLNSIAPDFAESHFDIPSDVTAIAQGAFSTNKTVTSVTIPASVNYTYKALENSAVNTVTFGDGVTTIPGRLFYRSPVETVVIPESVTTLEAHCFYDSNIKEIVIPEGITTIPGNAFASCSELEKVVIKGKDVFIDGFAFRGCLALKTMIILSDTLTLGSGMVITNTESNNEDPNNITVLTTSAAVKATLDASADFKGTTVQVSEYSEGLYKDVSKNSFFAESAAGVAAFADWRSSVNVTEGSPYAAWCRLLGDIDMAGVDYSAFNGHFTLFDGNGYTIKNLTSKPGSYYGKGGLVSYLGGGMIKNLTLEDATVYGCQVGLFAGQSEGGKIENCFIKGANTVVWEQCNNGSYTETYNGIGAVLGYNNGGSFTVEICAGATVALEAGTMTTAGTKVDNYTGYGAANSGTVTDNGKVMSIAKTVVSSKEELHDVLENAGAAGAGDSYITLNGDLDLTGTTWTPIKVDGYNGADIVTIDGGGHTITGLTAPLFAGGFAGGSGIVIKNLTIADSTITSANGLGVGAFIESVDSMDTITLFNCHLIDSSVTGTTDGARTGGLIGWTAGYNNVNDGPVKTYVTIENCSVIECTITSAGSVGGIYGHAGNNAWTYSTIKNCVVKDNTLNSTDDGGWRVGVVVGTANVGEVTISGITESGNTLTQTGKTAPAGQSNLYGRFVPGSTGKLTIDGVAIQ